MKNIITLTDFSEIANMAVDTAISFAKEHGANLTILHSLTADANVTYKLAKDANIQVKTTCEDAVNSQLDSWKDKALLLGVEAEVIFTTSNFIAEVDLVARHKKADLIIMGSTGAGNSNKIWGSNTQKLVGQTDFPVLVIKKPLTDYRMDSIVFASSFNMEDKAIFTKAISLLSPPQDTVIHFMSVDTGSYFSQPTSLMKEAMKDFVELAKPLKADSAFLTDYSVEAGIRHFLEEVKPDVLIMGSDGVSSIRHFLNPSAVIETVGNVSVPTLIMKY